MPRRALSTADEHGPVYALYDGPFRLPRRADLSAELGFIARIRKAA